MKKRIQILLFIFFLQTSYNYSQNINTLVTIDEKKDVLEKMQKLIMDRYIDESIGLKTIQYLNQNLNKGIYDTIKNANEFADKVSEDLVFGSNDKHFRLLFDPNWVADSKKAITKNEKDELLNRDLLQWKKDNFGFKGIKILDGNIGYLNLTSFKNPIYAGKTAEGSMAFLSNSDAIIIDLRENGGGFSTMVQLLASYFFYGEPIQMGDSYSRENDKHTQDWTLPYISGQKLPDIPLYILTSKESYSAAEGFTYFMKNRKRAIIIGETTGGAAQPIERVAVSERFCFWLPTQKPVDPITNTNWEGVGVTPDIPCIAKDALYIAQLEALKNLNNKKVLYSTTYNWLSSYLIALQNPTMVNQKKLESYAGDYGSRKLLFEGGVLYYQRDGDEKYKLIPMSDDLFIITEVNYLRIKIDSEKGKAIGITRLYIDGTSKKDIRSKIKK